MPVSDYEMNEALQGTDIEIHECPECGAALEHNVILDWDPAPVRAPTNYTPRVECGVCGKGDAGGAYGSDVAYELLETAGIDIEDAVPGERVEA